MDKTYSEQMLKVLQSLKDYIAIQDGLEIRLVSEISLAAGGEGYVFTLGDADQEQPERISTEQAVKDMDQAKKAADQAVKDLDQAGAEDFQAAEQDSGETPTGVIERHLGALPPQVKTSRRLLIAYFYSDNVRAWIINDLARAFGCRGREVATRAADYLGLTAEKTENAETETAAEEKNSGQ